MGRVGVIYWRNGDGVSKQYSKIFENLGHEVFDFLFNDKVPSQLDVVFLHGPWRSMVPLSNQLLEYPKSERPKLIWWISEQLPNPALPECYRYGMGRLRSFLERTAYHQVASGVWRCRSSLRWSTQKFSRFRYYGDLCWLRDANVLSLLVVSSPWIANYLRQRDFAPFNPECLSYYPDWGADLNMERDIPVLWIGKIATARRRRLLNAISNELQNRDLDLMMVDGEHHPYIFGQERTILLNRTKIVLNLLRAKWDNNAMRFHLASLNRAMIVTEPMLPHTSFVSGEHLVEAPINQIVDSICYYLSHDLERQKIADNAYELITRTTRQEVIAKVMEVALGKENIVDKQRS
ncbi:hypothetical protein ACFLUA_03355 [Chloroflexota bacterium]